MPSGLVLIGASAGGPAALGTILSSLPPAFGACVVVVQHIDAAFAAGMADWLQQQCCLPVRLALEGEAPARGTVLLAGTDQHLLLAADGRLGYAEQPAAGPYRPSVDVLFQSVARNWHGRAGGVLLTGMGRDGALGLKAMRERGWLTIAQDQASSAVYGMPKAAAALDAARVILPLERIAGTLIDAFP